MSILLVFISTSEINVKDISPDKVALYEKNKKASFLQANWANCLTIDRIEGEHLCFWPNKAS